MRKLLISNLKNLVLNFILFLSILFIIQNSQDKKKIIFLNNESVKIPVSFLIGTSYVSGSITGGLIISILKFDNKD